MRRVEDDDAPPPEIAAFIRFCHARRHVGWPDLYDEMCAVAARREFRGWGHDDLSRLGVTFALREMPTLAGWVRGVLSNQNRDHATKPMPAVKAAAEVQALGA
jgi:hypothetical protein